MFDLTMAGKARLVVECLSELWPAAVSFAQLWLAVGKLRPVAASGRGRGCCLMDTATGNEALVARCGAATPKDKQGTTVL